MIDLSQIIAAALIRFMEICIDAYEETQTNAWACKGLPPNRLGNEKGKEQMEKAEKHDVRFLTSGKKRANVMSLKGDGSFYVTDLEEKTCSCGYGDPPCSHLIAHAWKAHGRQW